MRINNIKKSLKKGLDYVISNSSKAIKTGALVVATTILPVNYVKGQATDIAHASTDSTKVDTGYTVLKLFHTIQPGQPYQFDLRRTDAYKGIKPIAKPMSNTGEFIAQFYNGITTSDDSKLTSVDSTAFEELTTSHHPRINDDEWRMSNGRQNNVEQTELLDRIMNNESKNDPLFNITKEESKEFAKIVKKGPTYPKYFIGVTLQYDGATILEDGKRVALPPLDAPMIIVVDNNNYNNNSNSTSARTRAYIGAGLENIFDKNYDNTANINRPILIPQAKLGLDFGRLNIGVIGGYGTPDVLETIESPNIQGNGGTTEEYAYKYNDIMQYGLEAGIDITKKLGMTFNAKKNQFKRTASGSVDQIVDDGQGNSGHVKLDLGTKNESYSNNTLGAGLVYHFNDNVSTTAEVDFNGKEPAAVSVNFVWTIGNKYK